MARRRYISTNISIDKDVNRLAEEHGDFAALLYTWMIPHADAEGLLRYNPEELMYIIVPGLRSKTLADVSVAINGIIDCGLAEIIEIEGLKYLKIDLGRWDETRTGSGRHMRWRSKVLRRDKYRCMRCGKTDCTLYAHHIKPWSAYPDLRYKVSNGITFCFDCHKAVHRGEE